MTPEPRGRSLLTAVSLFTVFPVPAGTYLRFEPLEAARAVRWLPVVGALVGGAAAVVLLLVSAARPDLAGRFLAALLAIGVMALLTGGMHLDGLADTVDGLGSRRPGPETLEIMQRSDIGPLGVAAMLFVAGSQVAALAAVPSPALAAGAVLSAAVTGRAAVVVAAGRGVPSARPGGFGALVAGSAGPRLQVLLVLAVLVFVAALAAALDGPRTALVFAAAASLGLLVADQVRRYVQRRISGVTGDTFGALVEVTTTVVLVLIALPLT